LYEIIPAGSKETGLPTTDPLRYQGKGESRSSDEMRPSLKVAPRELSNIKLRYKEPDGLTSKLFSRTVGTDIKKAGETTDRFRFSAAVAEFGMILRNSKHRGNATTAEVISLASGARGADPDGYRAEFIRLVQSAK